MLDDQTSSLVGVAISASLLPPAGEYISSTLHRGPCKTRSHTYCHVLTNYPLFLLVNCGMLFIVAAVKGDDWSNFSMRYSIPAVQSFAENNLELPNFAEMGLISLMLTVANVIMVAIGATLMFRLKEVLPVEKKVFWDDLKTARRIYQGRALDSVTGDIISVAQVSIRSLPSRPCAFIFI